VTGNFFFFLSKGLNNCNNKQIYDIQSMEVSNTLSFLLNPKGFNYIYIKHHIDMGFV